MKHYKKFSFNTLLLIPFFFIKQLLYKLIQKYLILNKIYNFFLVMQTLPQQNLHYVGIAAFKKLPKRIKIKLDNKKALLNSCDWQISGSEFLSRYWDQVFQYMEYSACLSLKLSDNLNEFIVQDIQTPEFTYLRYLNLRNNKIQNIESLVFLNTPILQKLDLSENKIRLLKPFNKLNLKELSSIQITYMTDQQQTLSRMKLKTSYNQNNQLMVSTFRSHNDLSSFAKLQTKRIALRQVYQHRNFFQSVVYGALQSKNR